MPDDPFPPPPPPPQQVVNALNKAIMYLDGDHGGFTKKDIEEVSEILKKHMMNLVKDLKE